MKDRWRSQPATAHGDYAVSPNQMLVALVLRVHSNGCVAEDGLRPRGGHRQMLVALSICHWIPKVVQRPGILGVIHLRGDVGWFSDCGGSRLSSRRQVWCYKSAPTAGLRLQTSALNFRATTQAMHAVNGPMVGHDWESNYSCS